MREKKNLVKSKNFDLNFIKIYQFISRQKKL
jgi:hypothetical protein